MVKIMYSLIDDTNNNIMCVSPSKEKVFENLLYFESQFERSYHVEDPEGNRIS